MSFFSCVEQYLSHTKPRLPIRRPGVSHLPAEYQHGFIEPPGAFRLRISPPFDYTSVS